jgi:hypothetical protein
MAIDMHTVFFRRFGAALCAIAAALWLFAGFWMATAASADGSLTIHCTSEDTVIRGMRWNCYRVADAADSITLQGDFAAYPFSLHEMTTSALQDAADTLENYAVLDGIAPLQSAASNAQGIVSFSGLETGWYLLTGTAMWIAQVKYIPSPMLVKVTASSVSGKAVEDVESYAKFRLMQRRSYEEQTYQIQKIWENDEYYRGVRPDAITMNLYCDGVLYDTVSLSEENDWRYQWSGSPNSEWRVKEVSVQEEYTVVYRSNTIQLAVVNSCVLAYTNSTEPAATTTSTDSTLTTPSSGGQTTDVSTNPHGRVTETMQESSTISSHAMLVSTDGSLSSETGTETETVTRMESTVVCNATSGSGASAATNGGSSGGSLPQTGQLWWPVPVCGAGGMILFGIGWRLHQKK